MRFLLGARETATGAARLFTKEHLANWGIRRGDIDDAALVVSELVTNSIQHALARLDAGESVTNPAVWLRLSWSEAMVVVEVWDGFAVPPKPPAPAQMSESGRGLWLVEAYSLACGFCANLVGKTAWAVLTAPAGAGPAAQAPDPARLERVLKRLRELHGDGQ